MNEPSKKPQDKPDLASFEANALGAVFGFYEKTITLLRQSSLDEEKKKVAGERIGQLMQNVSDEVERSGDWNVAKRLDSAYEEVKRLVDELANPHGGVNGFVKLISFWASALSPPPSAVASLAATGVAHDRYRIGTGKTGLPVPPNPLWHKTLAGVVQVVQAKSQLLSYFSSFILSVIISYVRRIKDLLVPPVPPTLSLYTASI